VYCTSHCTFTVYFLSRTYESKGFWRFSVGTGTKEDESSTKHIWAAEFHHVTARSRLTRVLKLMNRLFPQFSNFFLGCGKPWILNQWIWGHDCICNKLPSVNLMKSGQGTNEHYQHKTLLLLYMPSPLQIPFHLTKALLLCFVLTGDKGLCNAGREVNTQWCQPPAFCAHSLPDSTAMTVIWVVICSK
jgi:hypothetical protein